MQAQQSTGQAPATHSPTPSHASKRFQTFKERAETGPFTEAALRDQKFKAFDRKNSRGEIIRGNGSGPAGVWVQIGTKVIIDTERHDVWIASHRVQGE